MWTDWKIKKIIVNAIAVKVAETASKSAKYLGGEIIVSPSLCTWPHILAQGGVAVGLRRRCSSHDAGKYLTLHTISS